MNLRGLDFAAVIGLIVGLAAPLAIAEEVQVELSVPGVSDFAVARKAKSAVSDLGVKSVDVDAMGNTMRVVFDDEKRAVSEIVSALSSVGISVASYERK